MLQNLLVVTGQVITLFLMMAVGYALVRLGKLTDLGLGQMSTLLLYVVSPCLVLDAFQQEGLPDGLTLAIGFGAVGLGYLIPMVLSAPLFPRQSPETRSALRFGCTYGNAGFMGMPLVQMILGDGAVIYGAIAIALMNALHWSHGVILMGGKCSVKKAVVNPGVLPLLFALVLYAFHLRMPQSVGAALDFLGSMNTPLAMVVIGGQMASVNPVSAFTQPRLYIAAAFRLLAMPALTAVLFLPLGLSPLLYCVCVILAATPTAGATGIFSQRFGRDTGTAAQMVTLSTLLSIFTLPVFAVIAQALAGF